MFCLECGKTNLSPEELWTVTKRLACERAVADGRIEPEMETKARRYCLRLSQRQDVFLCGHCRWALQEAIGFEVTERLSAVREKEREARIKAGLGVLQRRYDHRPVTSHASKHKREEERRTVHREKLAASNWYLAARA